jgi:hypothetical protein
MRRSSRRVPPRPPIAERNHWRKVITVLARKIQAGDALVVKKGTVTKYYHICEVGIDRHGVEVVYNGDKGHFERTEFKRNEAVKVRRSYHD